MSDVNPRRERGLIFRFDGAPAQRAAAAVLLAACMALGACSSTPKDEYAKVSNEQLYADAKSDISSGNYERAIKQLEKLEARSAGTELSSQAQLNLAHAYYKSNERPQALATVERFIKMHPASPGLPYAYYLQGLINFNDDLGVLSRLSKVDLSERDQQASRDAYQSFRQVVERFPESMYAADSRLRMSYIINSLAAYEVHVARYYYARGAYLAAVNRAQQALQEFPSAPANEEALFLMMSSYDKLQLPALKADAERVLRKSFPKSPYLTGEVKLPEKRWWHLW